MPNAQRVFENHLGGPPTACRLRLQPAPILAQFDAVFWVRGGAPFLPSGMVGGPLLRLQRYGGWPSSSLLRLYVPALSAYPPHLNLLSTLYSLPFRFPPHHPAPNSQFHPPHRGPNWVRSAFFLFCGPGRPGREWIRGFGDVGRSAGRVGRTFRNESVSSRCFSENQMSSFGHKVANRQRRVPVWDASERVNWTTKPLSSRAVMWT
jgi:hypothetical protein